MRVSRQIELAFAERNIAFERDIPLSRMTSYGIGGPADLLAMPDTPEKTAFALRILAENSVQVFAIGKGTNLLVADSGFCGAIIQIGNKEITPLEQGRWEVGALAGLDSVVECTIAEGLADAVGLAGIPGSIGGGLAMNAGAWGYTVGSLAASICAFDLEGEELAVDVASAFEYRCFALRGKAAIFSAVISLEKRADPVECAKRVDDIRRKRAESQPLRMRSAGCVFKNPEGDHAGRLIDEAGLKGLSVGGASVSDIHANFIVTREGATASDVLSLVEMIRERVRAAFAVELELEVMKLGFGKE